MTEKTDKKVDWACPICGFRALDEDAKRSHLLDTTEDPEHRKAHNGVKEIA